MTSRKQKKHLLLMELRDQEQALAFTRAVRLAHQAASFGYKPSIGELPLYFRTHAQQTLDAMAAFDQCATLYEQNHNNTVMLQNRIEELTPLKIRIQRKANTVKQRLRNARLALNGTLH